MCGPILADFVPIYWKIKAQKKFSTSSAVMLLFSHSPSCKSSGFAVYSGLRPVGRYFMRLLRIIDAKDDYLAIFR